MPGLYVHVPFCLQKCAYCAFYSLPLGLGARSRSLEAAAQGILEETCGDALLEDYFGGLADEISMRQKDALWGVSSLFIGGGTPTALSPEWLEWLLKLLVSGFSESAGTFEGLESTSEANPGTITAEKLGLLRHYGINRISLGAQSFTDALLREIGRIHNSHQIEEAVRLIRSAGIDNLNLDLMFGLPGQSMEVWQDSVEKALKLEPEHLSLYALSLEEGTPLTERYQPKKAVAAGLAHLPDDDEQAEMYEWAVERLVRSGYRHYEVSNFALPGKECQHNVEIWRGGDYLGLGPGAVSTFAGVRWRNLEDIAGYRRCLRDGNLPRTEVEPLSERERMSERLLLGLRLSEGVSLEGFQREFGQDLRDIYQGVLETYLQQGLLFIEENRLQLNPRYIFTANAILQAFV